MDLPTETPDFVDEYVPDDFVWGPVDDTFVAARLLDDLVEDDVAINRRAARRAAGVSAVLRHVRLHPEVYTVGDGADDEEFAVRSALFDMSLRLRVSENELRNLDCTASVARESLPLLWGRACDGLAGLRFVEIAVSAILRLRAPVNATADQEAYAVEAFRVVDEATSVWALELSLAAFRRRVNALVARLDPARPEQQHARGMTNRRVVVEDADDGMSWVMALVPTIKALAIKRRLTAAAKHVQKDPGDVRTRDQVRADLFCDWLCGVGSKTAVKTKIFVTIPIGLLTENNTSTPGTSTAGAAFGNGGLTVRDGGVLPGETINPVTSLTRAQLVGYGPLDPATARQLFFEAKAFRRVTTDPVLGVVRDLDRRSYRPSQGQRDWLILQHGTCARDGCTRLAVDTDLDHERMWAHGGATDLGNLRPLCLPDHVRNHRTRIRYRSRPDRTVQVTTPTGHHTETPPPF